MPSSDPPSPGTPSSPGRPTLRDVAAQARVSVKTASRVVNGEGGVSPTLAGRVADAVSRLDYRPHLGASNLRRSASRSAAVGLLLEDVANPYSSALQRAVEDAATPLGMVVLSASLDNDPLREVAFAREFGDRRLDGLLLMPCAPDQGHLARELRAGTAVVAVDREANGLSVDLVTCASLIGARDAVSHLLAGGHSRIAYLGDRLELSTARDRWAGHQQAHERYDVPVHPDLVVHGLVDPAQTEAAVSALLERVDAPTALFTARNGITESAARALHRLGREYDVALVGFDDLPFADLLRPGITVVAQDVPRIGALAAEILLARIDGHAGPSLAHEVPTQLICRGSGELAPH